MASEIEDPDAQIKLTVVLKSANNLIAADKNGLSDPFVKIALGDSKHKSTVIGTRPHVATSPRLW
eukprot:131608-Prymnesium_polylepis.1